MLLEGALILTSLPRIHCIIMTWSLTSMHKCSPVSHLHLSIITAIQQERYCTSNGEIWKSGKWSINQSFLTTPYSRFPLTHGLFTVCMQSHQFQTWLEKSDPKLPPWMEFSGQEGGINPPAPRCKCNTNTCRYWDVHVQDCLFPLFVLLVSVFSFVLVCNPNWLFLGILGVLVRP